MPKCIISRVFIAKTAFAGPEEVVAKNGLVNDIEKPFCQLDFFGEFLLNSVL